ncbi:hypothetical protein EMIHUDRAFT_470281 [Emiliania huxleyi CCMP1516]|uniref:Uncharacterized protein n=2 Tax=Emiliania huxleyi TaxID=2903 RepID=A0A0D3J1Y8_EMIH1|nr:hypothetical protein EMIHUDRAFT_470281 [Emiliania huxleyi CCMP1516]EOD17523.1 hypothetical protein EMIHUDRAFT_470281 [Emiliania huxleyi CCMP1516]|eukprot:XP_005769952.1 hypothetical protein EMIHUDRAFT_470281 [Emiliania huxleyi CCMP1516]
MAAVLSLAALHPVLSLAALHPASPRHESRAYRSPLFSRRSAVLAPLATLLALPLSAVPASARSYKGDDPLTLRLRQSREELAACGPLLEQRRWDEVRKVTSVLLAAMTFKGYTGESAELTGAVSELDALLPEMGSDAHRRSLAAPLHLCDSWVVAGVCEILPQSKSLGDLVGRYTF